MTTTATARTGTVKRARTRDEAYSMAKVTVAPGRIVRLSDPEVKPGLDALVEELTSDPKKAQAWLQELGYLTPSGNVTRRYGGR